MGQLPRLYTEKEAAKYLGLKPATLARKRRAGEITSIKGRPAKYTEAHLLEYVERQTCPPTKPPAVRGQPQYDDPDEVLGFKVVDTGQRTGRHRRRS